MNKKLITLLALISVIGAWILLYHTTPGAPQPLGPHEGIGWWGWFDQGEYLKITEQFSNLDFFNPDKLYPPLYPGIAALLWPIFKEYGYIILDAGCTLLFFLLLIKIFSDYLTPFAVLLAVAFAYGFNRILFDQWVIPWTTNLSSLLIIYLAYLLHRLYRSEKRTYKERENMDDLPSTNSRKYLAFAFAICTTMLPLRPYEIIPCLVLTLGIGKHTLLQIIHATTHQQSNVNNQYSSLKQWKRGALNLAPTLVPAALIVIAYTTYNLLTFGSIEPSYSKVVGKLGFNFLDIGFKYASLVNDSSVFGLNDGHLTNLVPWYPLMMAAAIGGTLTLATPIRYLIAASLISQLSYISFNDLVPTGLFAFYNIHYFTWSISVIGVASFATIINLIKINIAFKQRSRKIIFISIFSIISLAVFLGSCKPNILQTIVKSPEWITVCVQGSENQKEVYTQITAFHQQGEFSKPFFSRLLILELPTESQNETIHTADGSELALSINDRSLTYRKDWRLVSRIRDGKSLLAILLQDDIPLTNTKIELKIGSKSNVSTKEACKFYSLSH